MFLKKEKSILSKVDMVRRITKVTSDVAFLLIQLKFHAVLVTNLTTSPNVQWKSRKTHNLIKIQLFLLHYTKLIICSANLQKQTYTFLLLLNFYSFKSFELAGGLDEKINYFIQEAESQGVPCVFGPNRKRLGTAVFKKVFVSCVAILNYEGAEVCISSF